MGSNERVEWRGRMVPEGATRRRLAEAEAVQEYWPDDLLDMADRFNAPWHSLTEPPRWDDVDPEVLQNLVRGYVGRHAAWPTVDFLRRSFERAPTTRRAGEHPDQETLGAMPVRNRW